MIGTMLEVFLGTNQTDRDCTPARVRGRLTGLESAVDFLFKSTFPTEVTPNPGSHTFKEFFAER